MPQKGRSHIKGLGNVQTADHVMNIDVVEDAAAQIRYCQSFPGRIW